MAIGQNKGFGSNKAASLKSSRIVPIIWAVIFFVFGLFLLINPGPVMLLLSEIIGIGVMLFGAFLIFSFIAHLKRFPGFANIPSVIVGALLIIFGIFIMRSPGFIISFISIIFGIALLSFAFNDFFEMEHLRALNDQRWWLSLVAGVLTLVLAIIVFVHPFGTSAFFFRIAGGALMFASVYAFLMNFRVRRYCEKNAGSYEDIIDGEAVIEDDK